MCNPRNQAESRQIVGKRRRLSRNRATGSRKLISQCVMYCFIFYFIPFVPVRASARERSILFRGTISIHPFILLIIAEFIRCVVFRCCEKESNGLSTCTAFFRLSFPTHIRVSSLLRNNSFPLNSKGSDSLCERTGYVCFGHDKLFSLHFSFFLFFFFEIQLRGRGVSMLRWNISLS